MRLLRLSAVLGALALSSAAASAQSTLVFLVRHGEKAAQPAADPPLTAEGEARAKALADVLAGAGIGVVMSTPYLRTLHTARPTAEKFGVKIDTTVVTAGVPAYAQSVADAVKKHSGKAILVVGHSNTITAAAAALGAPKLPDLCDGDYDQLFVLEIPAQGPARFARTRFGVVAADAKCVSMR